MGKTRTRAGNAPDPAEATALVDGRMARGGGWRRRLLIGCAATALLPAVLCVGLVAWVFLKGDDATNPLDREHGGLANHAAVGETLTDHDGLAVTLHGARVSQEPVRRDGATAVVAPMAGHSFLLLDVSYRNADGGEFYSTIDWSVRDPVVGTFHRPFLDIQTGDLDTHGSLERGEEQRGEVVIEVADDVLAGRDVLVVRHAFQYWDFHPREVSGAPAAATPAAATATPGGASAVAGAGGSAGSKGRPAEVGETVVVGDLAVTVHSVTTSFQGVRFLALWPPRSGRTFVVVDVSIRNVGERRETYPGDEDWGVEDAVTGELAGASNFRTWTAKTLYRGALLPGEVVRGEVALDVPAPVEAGLVVFGRERGGEGDAYWRVPPIEPSPDVPDDPVKNWTAGPTSAAVARP